MITYCAYYGHTTIGDLLSLSAVKSVALSNPDYLPERAKMGIRSSSPGLSKGFAVRSSPLLVRRPSPHPKSTSHSEKRLRLTIDLPKALSVSVYGLR
jgi:hypothetical protein